MLGFWTVFIVLVAAVVLAATFFVISVRRTISESGAGHGKMYRGQGAMPFWLGLFLAAAALIGLLVFANNQ